MYNYYILKIRLHYKVYIKHTLVHRFNSSFCAIKGLQNLIVKLSCTSP